MGLWYEGSGVFEATPFSAVSDACGLHRNALATLSTQEERPASFKNKHGGLSPLLPSQPSYHHFPTLVKLQLQLLILLLEDVLQFFFILDRKEAAFRIACLGSGCSQVAIQLVPEEQVQLPHTPKKAFASCQFLGPRGWGGTHTRGCSNKEGYPSLPITDECHLWLGHKPG